jgi:hypothetical protein
MSAEVLRSPRPTAARSGSEPALPPPGPWSAVALEPSLVNRLLGVAAAVFAVPVLLELRRLVAATAGPTPAQEAWLFAAAAVLAAGFALVLRRAPPLPDLRAGRVLCAALALEAAVVGAALLVHVAR